MQDNSAQRPDAKFADILSLLAELPTANFEAATAIRTIAGKLAQEGHDIGVFADYAAWLASWQRYAKPRLSHPRYAMFIASHGFAQKQTKDIVAYNAALLASLGDTQSPTYRLGQAVDVDLMVHDLQSDVVLPDCSITNTQTEAEAAHAMAYGTMAVDQTVDFLCLSIGSLGEKLLAAILFTALYPNEAKLFERLVQDHEKPLLEKTVARVQDETYPLGLLCMLGGPDTAASMGAILAARRARAPVLLNGYGAIAAALLLQRLDKRATDHCWPLLPAADNTNTQVAIWCHDQFSAAPIAPAVGITSAQPLEALALLPTLRSALAVTQA